MPTRKDRTIRLPSGQRLSPKEFRSQVAKLKKAGLISSKVDARSQVPTRYMRRMVARNQDVIQGHAEGVKVPRKVSEDYREHGFRVKGDRVILKKDEHTKNTFKNGRIVSEARLKNGRIQYIKLPIDASSLQNFLDDLRRRAPDFEKKIGEGYRLGFRFFGNYSLYTFPNTYALADYFERYQSVQEALNKGSNEEAIISNIELVRTDNLKMPDNPKTHLPPRYVPYEKRMKAIRKSPEKMERHREYEREKKRKQRAAMPEEARKKKQREERAASRAKRAAK